jgi:hypothetical protein
MSKAQTLKSVVKANLSEDAALKQYLTSRGINPKYVTKNQMVAHSKMGQFLKWKRDHNVAEAVDRKDTIIFDIPLLIRVLEFAREELKSDVLLHKMVERLISIRGKGTLTMNQYGKIVKEEVAEEEVEQIIEITTTGYHAAATKSRMNAAVKVMSSMGKDKQATTKLNARNAGLKRLGDRTSSEMKKANSGPQKSTPSKTPSDAEQRGYGQGRYMGDSVEHDDEVVAEMDNRTPSSDREEQRKNRPEEKAKQDKEQQKRLKDTSPEMRKKLRLPEPKESVVEAQSAAVRWQKALEAAKKKREDEATRNAENAKRALTPKNENYQDPQAATSMPGDCANSPDDVAPKNKNKKLIQMSKSARIIKNLYKKKGMKEETYDHEKEDKSVASYGKKPKMQQVSTDLDQPKAAAVLTGGTTLTGEKRDTIEIDPMMKMRKPISGKR